ncbi:hypothetical protein IKD98_03800 [Candidatus Saccharibacteria bacterium]|nr:hypothetical protein [Candidatus Saccharibacteria bacterium]
MKLSNIALGGMVGLIVVAGASLASNVVKADDVIDDVAITIPVSCTMTGTGQNTHSANVTNGTYEDDIGTTTLKVLCNDSEGFSIYAIGFTGDQYTGEDHTKLIGVANNQKIATGTATSGSVSNWAMKLETDGTATYALTLDNGFGSYSAVPDSYTKVAHKDSGTDVGTSAVGSTLTTTYASFIASNQVADTYSGKVKYTMVHPASETPLHPETTQAGQICYYPNGSNVEGSMGCQTISASATSATLLASNFSREGYGFAGWSKTFDYSDTTGYLGPQETITFTAGEYTGDNPGLSLYARWIKSAGSLQGWTGCSSLASGAVTALTDQRDNQTYAIAKLADGNCWMIENLRLENTGTDNANGSLAQGYGGQFAGLADPENAWANNITTVNSLYSTDGSDSTINIGTSNAGYRFPRYNHDNTSSRASTPTANTVAMYSYGNYYTWAAAIADTTAYSSGDYNTTSICPTGWKIPLGNASTGDIEQGASDAANKVTGFSYLDRKMGGTGQSQSTAADSLRWRKYPVNFVYSGYVSSGSVSNRGSSGYYWSSTASSSSRAYYLLLDYSSVNPGTYNNNKHYGRTVRCVASGS